MPEKETLERDRRDRRKGKAPTTRRKSPRRSRGVRQALRREPRSVASHDALSRQARSAARRRKKPKS